MEALDAGRRTFQLVVAATRSLGIGKDGGLPWRLPGELKYFKELTARTSDPTKQNAVIMGRRTWDSLPEKFRPLPGRVNVVLSRGAPGDENGGPGAVNAVQEGGGARFKGAVAAASLDAAMQLLEGEQYTDQVEGVFVIGGAAVYRAALADARCAAIHLTSIETEFPCDTFLPEIDATRFRLWSAAAPRVEKGVRYTFLVYTATDGPPPALPPGCASRHEELQYLDMIGRVMREGAVRDDRTGTGTLSLFGTSMRFNLRHTFPLLTTKRVFWRGVAQELLWFISGDTSARTLQEQGVRIWDGNGSREYLDSIGLTHREEGDLGPVYGFQWRHYGAQYTDMHADYTGQGIDQLADLIQRIKTNPTDRRLILTAWNPAALREMALPPCHMFCQFYVAHGELSCQMYQRSADLGLGVPFNIASYALLTHLLAHVCGLAPGELVHVLGDAHVYANHVEPLKEQLRNAPRHFPVLKIRRQVVDIDDFKLDDFELEGYNPHKKISMQMAV